jgi:hypothetical protein
VAREAQQAVHVQCQPLGIKRASGGDGIRHGSDGAPLGWPFAPGKAP